MSLFYLKLARYENGTVKFEDVNRLIGDHCKSFVSIDTEQIVWNRVEVFQAIEGFRSEPVQSYSKNLLGYILVFALSF